MVFCLKQDGESVLQILRTCLDYWSMQCFLFLQIIDFRIPDVGGLRFVFDKMTEHGQIPWFRKHKYSYTSAQ